MDSEAVGMQKALETTTVPNALITTVPQPDVPIGYLAALFVAIELLEMVPG